MSYAVYDCNGKLLVEPDLRTIKQVIADMLTDPRQESSVSLAHKKRLGAYLQSETNDGQ